MVDFKMLLADQIKRSLLVFVLWLFFLGAPIVQSYNTSSSKTPQKSSARSFDSTLLTTVSNSKEHGPESYPPSSLSRRAPRPPRTYDQVRQPVSCIPKHMCLPAIPLTKQAQYADIGDCLVVRMLEVYGSPSDYRDYAVIAASGWQQTLYVPDLAGFDTVIAAQGWDKGSFEFDNCFVSVAALSDSLGVSRWVFALDG